MSENTYYRFTSKTDPDECFFASCNYPIAGEGLLAALGMEEEYDIATISKKEYVKNTKED